MTPAVIMVLGVHRSGTSCLAGMLSALGLPMGDSGIRANDGNPKGFFEDRLLRRVMVKCGRVEFPGKPFAVDYYHRIMFLREWRLARTAQDGLRIGAKLPAMGNMVPEMDAAFRGKWKAIIPERPYIDSAKSRRERHNSRKPIEKLAAIIKSLADRRDADLTALGVKTLRIQFSDMMSTPNVIIGRLVDFCGLSPTKEQWSSAESFVTPDLNHFTEIR